VLEVTQERIDTFAKAIGDFQWIHVDRERAKASPTAHDRARLLTFAALASAETTFSFRPQDG